MAILADYRVLKDAHFELAAGDDETLSFGLPSDVQRPEQGKPAMPYLAWIINPEGEIQDLSYEVAVNGSTILSSTMDRETTRGLWEAFPGDLLDLVNDNEVVFRVTGGQGVLSFRDVILHFQRNFPSL